MKLTKPLWHWRCTLPASIEEVMAVLCTIDEGAFSGDTLPFLLRGKGPCRIAKEGEKFIAQFADHKETIIPRKQAHTIALRGQWWYEGTYRVSPLEPSQCIVHYEVRNIASRFRWIATLMVLPEKRQHAKAFARFTKDLKASLATQSDRSLT